MVETLTILQQSGKNTVANYSNDVQIVFEDYSIENENEYLQYSKSGNNLVIERYIWGDYDVSLDSSLVLSNFFKLSPDEITMTINGDSLLNNAFIDIEGKGKINGTFLDDYIMGSEGKDTVYASGGADDVETYEGNDTIYTSEQGSWVWAGQGNDKIYVTEVEDGGEITYENIFVFYPEDGSDTIYNSTNKDYIEVYDYSPTDLKYVQKGNNLVIQSKSNENDSITLIDYFKNNNGLEVIKFIDENYEEEYINISDQNLVTESQGNVVVLWNNENATIDLTNKKNAITYINGEGTKTIDLKVLNGNTVINLGNAVTDIDVNIDSINSRTGLPYDCNTYYSASLDGKDLIIINQIDTGKSKDVVETITIKNYFANSNLHYNVISFDSQNIDLPFLYGNLSMEGVINKNNFMNGQNFDFNMAFYGGNKNDTMLGHSSFGGDFYTGEKGAKTIITGSANDKIYVENFSNTDTMINDNSLIGNQADYTSDELHLYNSKKGEGAFIFFDVAADENNQPLEYSPNLYIAKNSNILSFMKGEYTPGFVSIENWFADRNVEDGQQSSGHGVIEHISFNGGEIDVNSYIERVTIAVKDCLETLNENRSDEDKYISAMDVLSGQSKRDKEKIIACYTKENAHITLSSDYLDKTFEGSIGNDSISVDTGFTVNAGKGNDRLLRKEDAEQYILNGEAGNDILEASSAGTILNGGKGENVIIVKNECNSIIKHGGGSDYIHFVNTTLNDLSFTKDGNDLIIESNPVVNYNQVTQKLILENYFKYNSKYSVKGFSFGDIDLTGENILTTVKSQQTNLGNILDRDDVIINISGTDNSETIKGTNYNDYIIAGNGIDKLYGNGGDNTFVFNSTSGDDTVYSGKGEDTLQFIGYNEENLSYEKVKNNLVIKYGENELTLNNYLKNPDKHSVESVIFGEDLNATPKDLDEIATLYFNATNPNKNSKITGTALNDIITGGDKNDTIKAGNGINEVTGGEGNDKLYGGDDETTFIFNDGDGQDTIYMGKGEDTIVINKPTVQEAPNFQDPIYSRSGNNLVITYGTVQEDSKGREVENTITISNYFKSNDPSVKYINYNGIITELNDIVIKGEYDSESQTTSFNDNIGTDSLIYINGKYNYVTDNGGSDKYQISGKYYTGINDSSSGHDTYEVSSLSQRVDIIDEGGYDQLFINEKSSNVNVLLEVQVNEENIENSSFSSMLIVNDKQLKQIAKTRDLEVVPTGVVVYQEGVNDTELAIDTIRLKDKWAEVGALKDAIASWLSQEGYECTSDILGAKDPMAEYNALMQHCNQAEGVWYSYN